MRCPQMQQALKTYSPLAQTVVEHIQNNAKVGVQGVQTGGGAATGRIT